MKLTKRAIDAFLYEGGWDVRWDDVVKGLGLRVYPSGNKSFLLRYTMRGGRKRTMTLGRFGELTLQQARVDATRTKLAVAAGDDPLAAKQRYKSAPTVTELADRYMAEHARPKKKPKSADSDERNLALYILPTIGEHKVAEVTRNDVSTIHHRMRATPFQANRVLALTSKLFNLAEKWGLRPDGSNPCRHVEKYRERSRERFLSHEELARLNEVLEDAGRRQTESSSVIAAIRLLILTGCRLNEILTLCWEDVDLAHKCLRLRDSKTGGRTVHLSAPALEVLANIQRSNTNHHVIVGKLDGAHLVNLEKPWRRIRSKAGLEDVRLHDLRHSFASIAASEGLSLHQIGGLLGHSQAQTTKRYAHLAANELKRVNETVGAKLEEAMASKPTPAVRPSPDNSKV